LTAFLGPGAHRDRRDEDQHDERQPAAQLVEVRQIIGEELGRPEGGERTEDDEHADEDVSGRVREIADEIALEDRGENVPLHDFFDWPWPRLDRITGWEGFTGLLFCGDTSRRSEQSCDPVDDSMEVAY
jgi:hypothetical protein